MIYFINTLSLTTSIKNLIIMKVSKFIFILTFLPVFVLNSFCELSLSSSKFRIDSLVFTPKSAKTLYDYDSSGRMIRQTTYYYITAENKYKANSKIEYSYIDSLLDMSYSFNWINPTGWDSTYKSQYKYDVVGRKIQEKKWGNNKPWEIKNIYNNYYDILGRDSVVIDTAYSSGVVSPTSGTIIEFKFNSDNKISERLYYRYGCCGPFLAEKRGYTYDKFKNVYSIINYDMTDMTGVPYPYSEIEYFYDTLKYAYNYILPFEYVDIKSTHKISYLKFYTYSSGRKFQGVANLYYNDITSQNPEITKQSTIKFTKLYNQIRISGLSEGQDIVVYNIVGNTILTTTACCQNEYISLPTHGIYIVKIEGQSFKIIY